MALFGNKKGKQKPLIGKKQPEYKQQQQHKKPSTKKKITALAIIIIAAIALYSYFVLQVNQTVITSSPKTVNITQQGALYSINSNQYYISLGHVSLSNAKAYIYISKLPIFINPQLNISLTLNNITKLNVGTNYSNIGIQLQSLSANSITVQISPIVTSLQIVPDSSKISIQWTSLTNSTGATKNTGASNTAKTTTTISTGTTASTSSASTTTVVPTNTTAANIAAALKKDNFYGLMLNYSILYSNESSCTQNQYNSAYASRFGSLPSGQNTYTNVSAITPYNLSSTQNSTSGGDYNIFFRAKTITFGDLLALTIKVNVSTSTVINNTISQTGPFAGTSTTYLSLSSAYATAKSEGACGIILP